ncbi:MAG: rhamnogalacturonan lyase B N-terminal domain-containing protein [Comamonas sp.]
MFTFRGTRTRVLGFLWVLVAGLLAPTIASAGTFGLTSTTKYYVVDTGAGLVFKIRRLDSGSNQQAGGDLASIVYNGVQYQDQSRGSQLNLGADSLYDDGTDATVEAEQVDDDHIKITVTQGDLIHYYLAVKGEARIYMGTVFTSEPQNGYVRYIVRVPYAKLPYGPEASDMNNATVSVESEDISALTTGETRSKHYSGLRAKDWSYIGATGSDIGMWMVRGNSEGMSGGPFYRCLNNRAGTDQEITYMINYGMAQTEDFRFGILNTYALVFTDGSAPDTDAIDFSWMADMGLEGYLSADGRGAVSGSVTSGIDTSTYEYTVGLSNDEAQYWGDVSASDGSFSIASVRPGDYTLKVYKNELAVYTGTATVSAGETTATGDITVTGDPSDDTALWRIGDWDGTPGEFLNATNVIAMHPSDPRLSSWSPGDYVVGESEDATGFPAYQWKDVNNSQVITFTLTSDEIVKSTVRVGITVAYGSARPRIVVNDWTSTAPSASTQPDTRSLTVGTYRGNNKTYSFTVPASALQVGENTLTLKLISGASGSDYLSPGVAYDAIDFLQ